MDETEISTTTNKPPKVLSTKGKKQVGIIASAERGHRMLQCRWFISPTILDICNKEDATQTS